MARFKNFASDDALKKWVSESIEECKSSYPCQMTNARLGVAVDIGANVGGFCIHAFNHYDKVYAFEPLVENCIIAQRAVAQAGATNVEIYNMAVHSKSGETLTLRAPPDSFSGDITCLNPAGPEFTESIQECQTISLEDIIKTLELDMIHFLKVDCEGSEYEIFKDFKDYNKILLICLELHDYAPQQIKRELLQTLSEHFYVSPLFHGALNFDELAANARQHSVDKLMSVHNIIGVSKVGRKFFEQPEVNFNTGWPPAEGK